jgi:hypothetical protein
MPTYLSPGVYVEEVPAGSRPIEGVGTAVAAFVGFAQTGPVNAATLVSNWTQYTNTFGDFVEGAYLAHAVYAYFQNGGGNCYVIRVGANGAAANGSHAPGAAKPAPEPAPPPEGELGPGGYRVVAREPAPAGEIAVEVQDAGGDSPTPEMFKIVVKVGGEPVEEFDRAQTGRGRASAVTMVNNNSKLVRLEEPAAAATRPATGTSVVLVAPPIHAPVETQAAPKASAVAQVSAGDYVGDVAARTGFAGLEVIDEVTMVAVPDLMAAYRAGAMDMDQLKAVQLGMIAHCELMGDRIAILDPPPDLNPQQIMDWRKNTAGYDSAYATLYWPWINSFDPVSKKNIAVPPCGHMAGIWGRSDETRGVHKAPANEVVRGAVSLATQITKNEHDLLNPLGINCLRAFPGRGIRVWGARTLSSDPAWRYLNVRRLFNYLEESILGGTNWVVFEPNDPALWARIRRTISAFLVNEWRRGSLFGLTPDEAFYVKCDSETNPAEGIDAGQVVCEIGVAPVKPAEFVIFRLAQFSGGTSLVSE